MNHIPYGKQDIDQHDIDSVVEVLRSDFLTQGPKVPDFEKSLISVTGAKYAIAANSATSALHISCMALELGPGDILWTSPITFVASSNCGLYCGAEVDFVDIDPKTYNMCPKKLEEKLIQAKAHNKLPKILVVVHLSGQSCDMQSINNLSKKYGFKIIEDASHGIGGSYKDFMIGGCQYSDIVVFSFHPVKIITTAEGGAALTNDSKIATKLELLRSHGITRDKNLMESKPDGDWYYQQLELGYNYRMTDLQAALGISQINRLNDFVESRHKLASRYNELLSNLPIRLPYQSPDTYSSFHLYIIRLNLKEISKTHRQVFDELKSFGLGVNIHYIPVHLHPYYKKLGFKYGDYIESESYYSEAISIPMYSAMTLSQQDFVVETLSKVLGEI